MAVVLSTESSEEALENAGYEEDSPCEDWRRVFRHWKRQNRTRCKRRIRRAGGRGVRGMLAVDNVAFTPESANMTRLVMDYVDWTVDLLHDCAPLRTLVAWTACRVAGHPTWSERLEDDEEMLLAIRVNPSHFVANHVHIDDLADHAVDLVLKVIRAYARVLRRERGRVIRRSAKNIPIIDSCCALSNDIFANRGLSDDVCMPTAALYASDIV